MKQWQICQGLCYTLLLCSLVHTGKATADKPDAPHHLRLPSYQLMRQNEDWSVLAAATPQEIQKDPWNKIKYVPLGEFRRSSALAR